MIVTRVKAFDVENCSSCGQDHVAVREVISEASGKASFICPISTTSVDLGDATGGSSE